MAVESFEQKLINSLYRTRYFKDLDLRHEKLETESGELELTYKVRGNKIGGVRQLWSSLDAYLAKNGHPEIIRDDEVDSDGGMKLIRVGCEGIKEDYPQEFIKELAGYFEQYVAMMTM
jgi:hypothetical protein